MDKHKDFSIEDFLQDDSFLEYLKNPTHELTAKWEQFFRENPYAFETAEEARLIFQEFNADLKNIRPDFYLRLKARIDETLEYGIIRKKKAFTLTLMQAAALLTGLVVGLTLLYNARQPQTINYFSYATKYAETKAITLPDSSEVMLNANTSLKFTNDRIDNHREVWITGEGFFKIRHIDNPGKSPVKFVVHANGVNVEVLGTQFNVKSTSVEETSVLLTTGKVRLTADDKKDTATTMHPGDFAEYSKKTNKVKIRRVSPDSYIAWTNHKYVFKSKTLSEVCNTLQGYYGKAYIVDDSMVNRDKFSGTLELQNEENLINAISALFSAQVTTLNNQVIFSTRKNSEKHIKTSAHN